MLHCLIEWAGVADRKNIFGILAARPTDLLSLDESDSELNLHRNFDPIADDLAVSLGRVTVADMEESS